MSLLNIDADRVFSGLEGLAFRGKWDEMVKKEVLYTCGLDKNKEATNDYHRRLQLIEHVYATMLSRDFIDMDPLALEFAAKYLKLYPASEENMTPQLILRIEARERNEQRGWVSMREEQWEQQYTQE